MAIRWKDEDGADWEPHDGKRLDRRGRALLKQARRPSFHCVHCGNEVPTQALNTKHRNHCPICLWSRHVDESVGDRKASCLSSMEPLGLSIKEDGGELMLVHRCSGCGKIGRNRIAGDDNTESIFNLLKQSLTRDESLLSELKEANVELCFDQEMVAERIQGNNGVGK